MTVQITNKLSVGTIKLASIGKGQRGKDLSGTVKDEALGALREASIAFETHTCSLWRGKSLVPQDTFFSLVTPFLSVLHLSLSWQEIQDTLTISFILLDLQ